MDRFKLSDCIAQLRKDLLAAAEDGVASGLRFEIEDVDLEFQMVVEKEAGVEAKASWWILSGGASAKIGDAVTQKMRLKLKAVDAKTGKPFKASGKEPRPGTAGR